MIFKCFGAKTKQNKVYNNNLPIDKTVISNHIMNTIDNRLQNKNASTDMLVFSSQNPYSGGNFIRNSSCWINGVSNISCFSPAQLSGANWWQRGGTLISPRHIILAKHFIIGIISGGTPILFVDNNNSVVTRKLIKYEFDNTDIAVGLLDNDVPSNIKFAKVLPKNYFTYFAPNSDNNYAVGLDAQEKAILKRIFNIFSSTIDIRGFSNEHPYFSFSENIITGDSGNPVFLIIDNELVLLTTWWFDTGGLS